MCKNCRTGHLKLLFIVLILLIHFESHIHVVDDDDDDYGLNMHETVKR